MCMMSYMQLQVSTGKDNEFAMKVAYHHRVAVEQALIELGCIEAREVPAQASSEPLPVQESSSGDVMSRDSGSRGASSSPQGSVAPKIRATKYYVGPTDNIDQRVYQVLSFELIVFILNFAFRFNSSTISATVPTKLDKT